MNFDKFFCLEKDVELYGQKPTPPALEPYRSTIAYTRDKHYKMFCMVKTAKPYPSISWSYKGEPITPITLENMKVLSFTLFSIDS